MIRLLFTKKLRSYFGVSYGSTHTSQNCRKPSPGHQTEAIMGNTMGGCDRIHGMIMNDQPNTSEGTQGDRR
jgi:hypothetical protein